MRLQAVIEQHDVAVDDRATDRRALKLAVRSQSPERGEFQVVVHNISRTGLLVEAPEGSLAVGDGLSLEVPEDGAVESKVVWESGRFYGCKFRSAVSQAAVSGALLQAEPRAEAPAVGEFASGGGVARSTRFVPELDVSAALAIALLLWAVILASGYLIVP